MTAIHRKACKESPKALEVASKADWNNEFAQWSPSRETCQSSNRPSAHPRTVSTTADSANPSHWCAAVALTTLYS